MIFKIQITILFVLVFSTAHGMKHFNNVDPDDDCSQRLLRALLRKIFCCGDANYDAVNNNNNNNGLNNQLVLNNQGNQQNVVWNQILINAENECRQCLDDNQANVQCAGNEVCTYCRDLYAKVKLSAIVHVDIRPGIIDHYGFCTTCLAETPNLFDTRKCPMCRQDVRDVLTCQHITDAMFALDLNPDLNLDFPQNNQIQDLPQMNHNAIDIPVENHGPAGPRVPIKYNGALLAMPLGSASMFYLSYIIAELNKHAENKVTDGEYEYSFWFNLMEFTRGSWGFLGVIFLGFLIQKREHLTILINNRGWLYLLLPMITSAILNNQGPWTAQWASIVPLIMLVLDFYQGNITRTSWIVPRNILIYSLNEPQYSCYGPSQLSTWIDRLKSVVKFTAQYMNFSGSIAPLAHWKMSIEVYETVFDMDVNPTYVMVGTIINALIAFGIALQSHAIAFQQNENILVFSQFAQLCFVMFFMYHANPYVFGTIIVGNFLYTLYLILAFLHKKCFTTPAVNNNNNLELGNNNI